jgi:hypothetical protein
MATRKTAGARVAGFSKFEQTDAKFILLAEDRGGNAPLRAWAYQSGTLKLPMLCGMPHRC